MNKQQLQNDASRASCVMSLFRLFVTLRTAADNIPAEVLVEHLKRVESEDLAEIGEWLEVYMNDRFIRAIEAMQRDERINAANALKAIPAEQRAAVDSLNASLLADHPQKTPRYREIANRLDLTTDRVRYIIEGPRRG